MCQYANINTYKNVLESPLSANAVIEALTPGIISISILFALASLTISKPGSFTNGIPASETRAIL